MRILNAKRCKAQTKKAYDIHEYYLKLEDIFHEIFEEETKELKEKLLQKENIITEIKQTTQQIIEATKRESKKEIEKAIVAQFPVNTECIYFGTIDDTNEAGEEKLLYTLILCVFKVKVSAITTDSKYGLSVGTKTQNQILTKNW